MLLNDKGKSFLSAYLQPNEMRILQLLEEETRISENNIKADLLATMVKIIVTLCKKLNFLQENECTTISPRGRTIDQEMSSEAVTKNGSVETIDSVKRSFSCPVCAKKFNDRSNFRRHQRIHTGDKPFSCLTCDKKFIERAKLRIHEKIHAGDKQFTCSLCNKGFITKQQLVLHERMHTNDKPFSCSKCKTRFLTKQKMEQHNKKCSRGKFDQKRPRLRLWHSAGSEFATEVGLEE